jgi:zinc transport system permease protein
MMVDNIFFIPLLALILSAASCSLLGVFVLWKKLAYFGDAISHSILLGIVIGAIFDFNQVFSLVFFSIFFALLVSFCTKNQHFSKDTMIAISSYICIALAIIFNTITKQNLNLSSYIFGDILTVSNDEIGALFIICLVIIFFTIFAFKKILLINVNADLAKIDGIRTEMWNILFLTLLAITIALSVRIVGIFLMTALLILPATIARLFATSALQMIIFSLLLGIFISAPSALIASNYNLPIGAFTVLMFGVIFILFSFCKK